ncbi:MAG: hypothetical protein ACLQBX_03875 [Candidatus Limnocylindrales bacterium]|jgi:hypothetical protein
MPEEKIEPVRVDPGLDVKKIRELISKVEVVDHLRPDPGRVVAKVLRDEPPMVEPKRPDPGKTIKKGPRSATT